MYIPNLSVVCFFICLSYFIFYCALLLFCAQAWHGTTLSSRNVLLWPDGLCSIPTAAKSENEPPQNEQLVSMSDLNLFKNTLAG